MDRSAKKTSRAALWTLLVLIASGGLVAFFWRSSAPMLPAKPTAAAARVSPSPEPMEVPAAAEAPEPRAVVEVPVLATPPPTTLTVVLHAGEGPVAGARIEAHADGVVLVAATDELGTVSWDDVPAGAAVVRSARGCEETTWIEQHEQNRVELTLPAGIEVYGRVVDPEGQAVPGAAVYLARPVTVLRKVDPVAVASTDAEGRFRVLAVPSGAKIGARAAGHQASLLHPILHPRIRGTRHELVIVVRRGGCDLRGTVVDEDGVAVRGAEVELNGGRARTAPTRGDGPGGYTWPTLRVRTAAAGRFVVLGQRAGEHDLIVRSARHAPWHQRVQLAAGEVRQVEVRLAAGASLQGVVTTARGAPIAGATIERAGQDGAWFRGGVPTQSARDGAYAFTGLAPGAQKVHVRKDGYAPVTETVMLRVGHPARLDPVLQEHPRVAGRVIRPDGSPCAGVRVRGHAMAGGRPTGFAVTDSTGGFELACPEGEAWKLHVSWGEHGIEIDSGVAAIRGARTEVVVVLDASREATAALRGRIAGLEGRPLLGAWLQLRTAGVNGQRQQLRGAGHTSVEDGAFSIGPVPPGEYWLRAHPPATGIAAMEFGPFQLAPRDQLDVGTLQPRAGSLTLDTRFAEGTVPQGAAVTATVYEAATELTRTTITLDGRAPARVVLPPGRYFVGAFVQGYQPFRSGPFEVEAGADVTVAAVFRRSR